MDLLKMTEDMPDGMYLLTDDEGRIVKVRVNGNEVECFTITGKKLWKITR